MLPKIALLFLVLHFVSIANLAVTAFSVSSLFINHSTDSRKQRLSSCRYATPMDGCVCVVTGASRGIGKGIAIELGKAGATVYVTGTSTTSQPKEENHGSNKFTTNDAVGGPGTIEQTAQEINDSGGVGIPVYCDHSNDEQVKHVFNKVEDEQGRLDLLVNNAFRISSGGVDALFSKFWEEGGIETWDAVHTVGLRSHYVASCYAVPLMKKNIGNKGQMKRPLIAMISSFGGLCYTFNVAYGVGKCAVDRLCKDMAVELDVENIGVTSFYPGVVLTERMRRTVDSGDWDKQVGIPLDNAESPAYTGRGIIAVATDDYQEKDKSGTLQVVAELAKEYGFTDIDGRQPPSIRSLKFLLPAYAMDEKTRKLIPDFLIPDWKLPFFIMANGAPPSQE